MSIDFDHWEERAKKVAKRMHEYGLPVKLVAGVGGEGKDGQVGRSLEFSMGAVGNILLGELLLEMILDPQAKEVDKSIEKVKATLELSREGGAADA